MPKLKPGIVFPSDSEDAKIRAAAEADPDTMLLEDPSVKLSSFKALREARAARSRGRPVKEAKKVSVSIRYSPEVIETFKATGSGWQTRMDDALKEWIIEHTPSKVKS